MLCCCLDAAEAQRLQSEDRGNKLKQLLVKTKKDLAEAKKTESEQRSSDAQVRGQLEFMTQQVEDYKVGGSSIQRWFLRGGGKN